jgi:hypothetical protein
MGEEALRRRMQKSELFTKKLIKGLYDASTRRLSYLYLPTVYENRWLRAIHHPKLKKAYLELTNKCICVAKCAPTKPPIERLGKWQEY